MDNEGTPQTGLPQDGNTQPNGTPNDGGQQSATGVPTDWNLPENATLQDIYQKLPPKLKQEWDGGHLMHSDYTRKTQEISLTKKERDELKSAVEERDRQLEAMKQLYGIKQALDDNTQPEPQNGDKPLTAQEVMELINRSKQEQSSELRQYEMEVNAKKEYEDWYTRVGKTLPPAVFSVAVTRMGDLFNKVNFDNYPGNPYDAAFRLAMAEEQDKELEEKNKQLAEFRSSQEIDPGTAHGEQVTVQDPLDVVRNFGKTLRAGSGY